MEPDSQRIFVFLAIQIMLPNTGRLSLMLRMLCESFDATVSGPEFSKYKITHYICCLLCISQGSLPYGTFHLGKGPHPG